MSTPPSAPGPNRFGSLVERGWWVFLVVGVALLVAGVLTRTSVRSGSSYGGLYTLGALSVLAGVVNARRRRRRRTPRP